MSTQQPPPKAAAKFVADAQGAGFKVKVNDWGKGLDVEVRDADGTFRAAGTWMMTPYGGKQVGGKGPSYYVSRDGVSLRFSHGTVVDYGNRRHEVQSVRRIRTGLGLAD